MLPSLPPRRGVADEGGAVDLPAHGVREAPLKEEGRVAQYEAGLSALRVRREGASGLRA